MKPQQALPVVEKSESLPLLEEKLTPIQNEPEEIYDDDEEDPICGPAETITGETIIIILDYFEDSTNDCILRNHWYPSTGTANELYKLRLANKQRH